MSMELLKASRFESVVSLGQSVTFVQFNAGAPYTVLYCYGAGNTSFSANLYQDYLHKNKDVSMICIDRWCLGSTSPPELWLRDLSAITAELLQRLSVSTVVIAAHSAGIYQALDLASRYPELVKVIYAMCSHIPVRQTNSSLLNLLTKMPNSVLDLVGRLDSVDLPRKFARILPQPDEDASEESVVTIQTRSLVRKHIVSEEESRMSNVRREADYTFIFEKKQNVTGSFLLDLYTNCDTPITWFTSTRDSFFGPDAARAILAMSKTPGSEVIEVNSANHGNILFKSRVWDKIISNLRSMQS